MKIILLTMFAATAVVNLIACATGHQKLRSVTKLLLMPLLAGVYIFSVQQLSWPIAALFFGWAGDYFLINKSDDKQLSVGIAAFGAGHVFYIVAMLNQFQLTPPKWTAITLPAVFLAVAVGFFLYLRQSIPPAMTIPAFGYALLLCSAAAVAGLVFASGEKAGVSLFIGALMFLASDGILSLETFRCGDRPYIDYFVMLTYIAAQFLLVNAFIMQPN